MSREMFTFDVNEELCKIRSHAEISKISKISNGADEIVKKTSLHNCNEISKISRISRASAADPNFPDKNKVAEVTKLIRNYAQYWGETEENIEEYISDQLAAFPLDDLITCFRSLNADIQNLECPPANVANIAKSTGK